MFSGVLLFVWAVEIRDVGAKESRFKLEGLFLGCDCSDVRGKVWAVRLCWCILGLFAGVLLFVWAVKICDVEIIGVTEPRFNPEGLRRLVSGRVSARAVKCDVAVEVGVRTVGQSLSHWSLSCWVVVFLCAACLLVECLNEFGWNRNLSCLMNLMIR